MTVHTLFPTKPPKAKKCARKVVGVTICMITSNGISMVPANGDVSEDDIKLVQHMRHARSKWIEEGRPENRL
jgi:hypothetical protein